MPSLRPAVALTLTVLVASSAVGCTVVDDASSADDTLDGPEPTTAEALSLPVAQGPLAFSDPCRAGTRVTIAALGDVLLHSPLQRQAYAAQDGHHSLWRAAEPLIQQADLAYANFEGPSAAGTTATGATVRDPGKVFDDVVYTSYPMFNYHGSLVASLVESGIDVVSTANNHAMDRRSVGADRTIAALSAGGLPFTGTRPADDPARPWHVVTERSGVKIAWIACTFSTNGIPDSKKQVLLCYQQTSEIEEVIRAVRARGEADAVIVTPHWGNEYEHNPSADQKKLARRLLDAGATAIVGNHPHVLQPWEKYVTTDGREGFVVYSLGNFVSGQSGVARKTTIVLYLGLTKGADGKVTVNGVRHVPLTMRSWTVEPSDKATNAAESHELATQIFGKWNEMASTERLDTTPGCR
jgi:poly-gamma-glutamate synthesis protein (capsule biosynthesis protein)